MRRDDEFIASLCPSFDLELDGVNFQFLWLIPIIEVMWADGRCQREEIELLFHYVDRFVRLVRPDFPALTEARARRFLQPFLDASVGLNPRKRAELGRLRDYIVSEVMASALPDKRAHLFQICVEVAASAQVAVSDPQARRIMAAEERLLADLCRELRL